SIHKQKARQLVPPPKVLGLLDQISERLWDNVRTELPAPKKIGDVGWRLMCNHTNRISVRCVTKSKVWHDRFADCQRGALDFQRGLISSTRILCRPPPRLDEVGLLNPV